MGFLKKALKGLGKAAKGIGSAIAKSNPVTKAAFNVGKSLFSGGSPPQEPDQDTVSAAAQRVDRDQALRAFKKRRRSARQSEAKRRKRLQRSRRRESRASEVRSSLRQQLDKWRPFNRLT